MSSFTPLTRNDITWHEGKPFVQSQSQSQSTASSSAMAQPTEKKFACKRDGCNAGYTNRKALWRHEKAHEGMRYPCSYGCGRTFTQTNNLKEHERSIHENQSYLCQIGDCNQVFGRLDNFKKHQVDIHPDKKALHRHDV